MVQQYFPLILAIVFLSASAAFAEEKAPVNICQKNKDCVLVIYNCNQALVFAKSHAAKEKEKLCKSEDCSLRDCEDLRHFSHSAQCVENQCVLKSIPRDDLDPGGKKWIARFVHTKRPNFAKNEDQKNPVAFGSLGKPAQ